MATFHDGGAWVPESPLEENHLTHWGRQNFSPVLLASDLMSMNT